jgi:predicted amidohydrolase
MLLVFLVLRVPQMSQPFVIAAAQTIARAGDIPVNLACHLAFVEAAAAHDVRLLVFPELSLTGYELALAREVAIHPDDERLQPLREAAQQAGMTVVVGAPVWLDGALKIGALALLPDGGLNVYAKQFLHAGEDVVFEAGQAGMALNLGQACAALAICADIVHPEHARQAALLQATLYAAGVLISDKGYAPETELLQGYAREHRMAVLMANYGGQTGGWMPAGKSAVWDENGVLVTAADGLGEALVMAWQAEDGWRGEVLAL